MKNQNLKTFCTTALISAASLLSIAHAQGPVTPVPGYLPEFDYQVTNFNSIEEAKAAMNSETTQTSANSICANRAAVWSYNMNRTMNVNVGKMFIFFTENSKTDEDSGEWAFHVAPYVLVNGQEYVLDMGFGVFKKLPVTIDTWSQHFSAGGDCQVLDPVHNPDDLALEKNDVNADWMTPLTGGKYPPRQYPPTNGHNCYLRKMPMYYSFPIEVYGVDLFLAGQAEYKDYLRSSFDPQSMIASCRQATTVFFKLAHSCEDYLGLTPPSSN
jgi:hypothetical protein